MTFVTDVSLFLLPVALLRTQKMPDLNNKSLPPNRYFIFLPLLSKDQEAVLWAKYYSKGVVPKNKVKKVIFVVSLRDGNKITSRT